MSDESTHPLTTLLALVVSVAVACAMVLGDGGLIFMAWHRIVVVITHPAFHLTYKAACGVDVLMSLVLVNVRGAPKKSDDETPAETVKRLSYHYAMSRLVMWGTIAAMGWWLS